MGEDDDEELPDKNSSRDLLGGFLLREGPGGVSVVNYRYIFTSHISTAKITSIKKIPEKKRCFHFEPYEPMLVTAFL